MANVNNLKATIIKTFIRERKEYNYKDIFEARKLIWNRNNLKLGKKMAKKYIQGKGNKKFCGNIKKITR